ncbi:hypothetical protein [Parvularcula dongshanensis]|nr:hypothetical protein [Parvularcula dongshanensis]
MSALALMPRRTVLSSEEAPARGASLPHLAGASLPPSVRTAGALALLLLAVAVTGLILVAFAVAMPVLLLLAAVSGRLPRRAARPGWRPAPA